MTLDDFFGYAERIAALAGTVFVAVRWMVLPAVRAHVQKLLKDETGDLQTMRREIDRLTIEHEFQKQRLEEMAKIYEELPLIRQAVGEVSQAVDHLTALVDRMMTLTEVHSRELGRIQGRTERDT